MLYSYISKCALRPLVLSETEKFLKFLIEVFNSVNYPQVHFCYHLRYCCFTHQPLFSLSFDSDMTVCHFTKKPENTNYKLRGPSPKCFN